MILGKGRPVWQKRFNRWTGERMRWEICNLCGDLLAECSKKGHERSKGHQRNLADLEEKAARRTP